MGGWMKTLVATACAVVIAGGGWFAWGAYSAHSAQAERNDRAEGARKELFRIAQAGENDREKVVSFCSGVDDIINNIASSDTVSMWRQVKANCRALGYL